MKLLKVVTTFQSVVTILDPKLDRLNNVPGIELYVTSSREDPFETRTPHGCHYPISIPRTIRPFQDVIATFRMYRFIRQRSFDVVHTHTAKAGIIGTVAARLAGVSLICHTYHGLPFYKGQSKLSHYFYKIIEIMISHFRHVIFSQNKSDLETLRTIPSFASKIIFEGNGVNIETIERNAAHDVLIVREMFREKGIRILCSARLEHMKRLDRVVKLITFLKISGIPVQGIIAGKGKESTILEELIKREGVSDSLKIIYTPAIHALIAISDIILLTSEKEGIPRSLMEAMALKKPVVATDVLGTNELVIDNETGFLVPLGDQDALNKKVVELINNPVLRQTFGANGYSRVKEYFDDKKIVDKWLKAYELHINNKIAKNDTKKIASLHIKSISEGFLSTLGVHFLSVLYKAIASDSESCLLTEQDEDGRIIGFVAATLSVSRCYKRIIRKHFLSLSVFLLPKIFSLSVLKRIFETLCYPFKHKCSQLLDEQPQSTTPISAELLSIAVSDSARGKGIGRKLVGRLEEWFKLHGLTGEYKVVTYTLDARSNAFYEATGFKLHHSFLHHGNKMNEYRKAL